MEIQHGRKRTVKHIIVFVDFLASLLFLTCINGTTVGSTDDMFIIPGVYQLQNTELYQNDIAYSGVKDSFNYHAFGQYLVFLLSKFIPIELCFFILITLWRFCLLLSMSRLVEQVCGRKIPVLAISLLLFNNPHLVGYHLTANVYAVHFAALSLSLLSLSYFIGGCLKKGALALFLAGLFHPLVGVGTLIFVSSIWFFRSSPKRKIAISVAALTSVALGYFFLTYYYTLDKNWLYWTEIGKIRLFIRGPWHLSPEYWGKYEILNFGIAMLLFSILWRTNTIYSIRLICFSAIVAGSILTVAMVNNSFYFDPFLILIDPFEIGPLVLALLYVLMVFQLTQWIGQKYYLSSLAIFISISLQAWSLFLVLLIIMQYSRTSPQNRSTSTWKRDVWILLLLLLISAALKSKLLGISWLGGISIITPIQRVHVLILAATGLFVLRFFRKLAMESLVVVLVASYILAGAQLGQLKWFEVERNFGKDWLEVCDFIEKNTPVESTFIIPPDIESFQYLSRRSAFFSFKHFPPELNKVHEWYKRSQLLGLVPRSLEPELITKPVEISFNRYNELSTDDFLDIKKQYDFVNYCIVRKDAKLLFPVYFYNSSFKVYNLSSPSKQKMFE